MILRHLSLTNFKNIAEASLDFSPGVNCLLGDNGMGKSNLLDAIYTLSMTRSFTGVTDAMLVSRGADFAIARADYTRCDADETLSLGIAPGRRKSLRRQGKDYRRLSEHIGVFPLVMVSPHDIDLVRGASEERRRWMDMVISQGDARYLDALIRYNRGLEQRNKMLRDGIADVALFQATELPMAMAAGYLTAARRRWIDQLQELFSVYYARIAGEGDSVGLAYSAALGGDDSSLEQIFERNRDRDRIVGHTTSGPHRDDIEMTLNAMPLRRTGSQGQCKSFTIALRLAQFDFLHRAAGFMPLLLLDDIFDKLDAGRVERIMSLVTGSGFGQIFITDTNRRHLDEIVARAGGDYRLWSVENGVFTPITSSSSPA